MRLNARIDEAMPLPADRRISWLIPEAFEARAIAHPDLEAVRASDATLTCGDLLGRARALAGAINALGLGRESLIALAFDRSAGMVSAIAGVMLSGAAWLPLDPANPESRLETILREARPALLLADAASAARMSALAGMLEIPFATLDAPSWGTLSSGGLAVRRAAALDGDRHDPSRGIEAGDLAYVIYTSGSTGTPKGVEVEHGSFAHVVDAFSAFLGIGPGDRGTQLAAPAFDAVMLEIWPFLVNGGSISIAPDELRVDPPRLADWLAEEQISVGWAPAALTEQLLRGHYPSGGALRTLVSAADVLHSYPPADLPFELVNGYGPTEATVATTLGRVPRGVQSDRLPSIGRPLRGVHVHLVDEQGREVAEGEPGELLIGGGNVARGYRHRPDLTAERFIADSFCRSGRLYRSGDLARWRDGEQGGEHDPELEFLGRVDDQVKIRGNRIEPQEIALVLGRRPEIAEVFVHAQPGPTGEPRLVAYLVPTSAASGSGAGSGDAELRAWLAERLPDYMVPTAFVRLGALPLTSNGKVDRRALPVPDDSAGSTEGEREATPVEAAIREIEADLIGVAHVPLDGDFFLLGGHSLLAGRLAAAVSDLFGIELPLRAVFEHPVLEELAVEVEQLVLEKLGFEDGASEAEAGFEREGEPAREAI